MAYIKKALVIAKKQRSKSKRERERVLSVHERLVMTSFSRNQALS